MPHWKTPRPLENRHEIDLRLRPNQLYAPHVQSLNKLVERIRESKWGDLSVPWFDPAGAGINARVLILQQDPSRIASDIINDTTSYSRNERKGTGFISPDNPDQTADNTTMFRDNAGLKSSELIHWNIIPWFIGEKKAEIEILKAKDFLVELIDLLSKLEVVVCMGIPAKKGWNQLFKDNNCVDGWKVSLDKFNRRPIALSCPHPSPQSLGGKHTNEKIDGLTPSQRIEETLLNVRKLLDRNKSI